MDLELPVPNLCCYNIASISDLEAQCFNYEHIIQFRQCFDQLLSVREGAFSRKILQETATLIGML